MKSRSGSLPNADAKMPLPSSNPCHVKMSQYHNLPAARKHQQGGSHNFTQKAEQNKKAPRPPLTSFVIHSCSFSPALRLLLPRRQGGPDQSKTGSAQMTGATAASLAAISVKSGRAATASARQSSTSTCRASSRPSRGRSGPAVLPAGSRRLSLPGAPTSRPAHRRFAHNRRRHRNPRAAAAPPLARSAACCGRRDRRAGYRARADAARRSPPLHHGQQRSRGKAGIGLVDVASAGVQARRPRQVDKIRVYQRHH